MTTIAHDKPEQLKQIQEGLLDGEQVQAVYDCTGAGTGFVGVTDRRVILQDKSFYGRTSPSPLFRSARSGQFRWCRTSPGVAASSRHHRSRSTWVEPIMSPSSAVTRRPATSTT